MTSWSITSGTISLKVGSSKMHKECFCLTFLANKIKVCYSSRNVYLRAWFVPCLGQAGRSQGERNWSNAHGAVMRCLIEEYNNVIAHIPLPAAHEHPYPRHLQYLTPRDLVGKTHPAALLLGNNTRALRQIIFRKVSKLVVKCLQCRKCNQSLGTCLG